MKVTAQKLTQELKKYKKIILELNAALEIVNKPCPKQHGMTQEEKDELEAAVSEAEKYHEKNDKLSKMVADISAENVRLRDALRSAKSEHEETDLSRKYRQAQITIQEQQQQIQALQSKSGKPKTQDSYLLSRVKGLEEARAPIETLLLENDAMINDIEQKKKAMKDLQQELNENSIKLFDAKQHLKSKTAECEKLAKKIASHGKPVDESTDHLIQENKLLFADLQSREKEIAALEDEIIKLLSFYEGDNPVKPIDNEKLTMLESMIQERDGRISELTDEITTLNKSHYQDIKDLEKHLSKIQIEIQEKNEANTHLMTELKNSLEKQNQIQKEYEEKLEKQFNDLAVAIRERDVKIATLEGEREAQEDTVEREKEFLKEEIDDLNNRIDLALQELEEKDRHTLELKDIIAERKGDNSEISRLKEELQKLARIDEEWKERTSSLNNELDDKLDAYRTLKQEWEKTKEKNEILNKMLKAAEDNMKSNKVEQRFQKLNIELRKNLEEKSKDFDRVKAQLHDIQTLYNEQVELNDELEKRLRKRENMLSHSLSTFDVRQLHFLFIH
ncbi:hypothetical protein CU098_012440 [Rhizopus stolonifer]|uniref:Uncharacterized protein n=1 Tax=Rhizopus stolonifer TaxID=4846 RepID=A0A367KVS4_RHIST|nr:hypothetical protein CU098_012440 [Rhizopus stolonifer]